MPIQDTGNDVTIKKYQLFLAKGNTIIAEHQLFARNEQEAANQGGKWFKKQVEDPTGNYLLGVREMTEVSPVTVSLYEHVSA